MGDDIEYQKNEQNSQNQMGGYSQQYLYPNQQAMKPPKKSMDPAKKKRVVVWLSIGGGILTLGIAALIIVPILLYVDYSPAYNIAKDLKSEIYDIHRSYDCSHVVEYVNSVYTNQKDYGEYVEGCKEKYSSSVNELIAKLESTDGVKRNDDIRNQFFKFKSEYDVLQVDNAEVLSSKFALWQAEHSFVYVADDLSYSSSSDAEFAAAANYLVNSGNEVLKTYGEGWLEKSLAVAAAYRDYRAAPWQTSSQLYSEYNNKKKEKDDWVATNKPDINIVAPLNLGDTSKMYSEFTKLYELISSTYQENYNFESDDCAELWGEVYCE